MNQDNSKSVYDQPQTTLQLQSKLSLCERAMAMRPILTKFQDQEERVLTAAAIGEPSMSGTILTQTMEDLMSNLPGTQSELFREILNGNAATLIQFKEQLLSYLQDNGKSYKDSRKGGGNKQSDDGLSPLVDDFVTYKSGAKTRFGKISEILSDNLVILTVIKRNRICTITVHVRTIRCVYRSSDMNNCSNI